MQYCTQQPFVSLGSVSLDVRGTDQNYSEKQLESTQHVQPFSFKKGI